MLKGQLLCWLLIFGKMLDCAMVRLALIVQSVLYPPNKGPPSLPIAVLVHFPHYTGPAFTAGFQSSVSTHTTRTFWMGRPWPKTLSPANNIETALLYNHSQVPWADLTSKRHWHWKAGKSSRMYLSLLLPPESAPYKMLYVFQPMTFRRLQSISNSKRLQERLGENQRLQDLAAITALHFQH